MVEPTFVPAVTVTEVLLAPALMVAVAGSVATSVSLLARFTVTPPAGAGAVRLTDSEPVAPTVSDSVVGVSLSGGKSSLRIVPVPRASPSVAFTAPERSTKNVSLGSMSVSPLTLIVMVCGAVLPAGNVTVPLAATKSEPAVAVPLAVA